VVTRIAHTAAGSPSCGGAAAHDRDRRSPVKVLVLEAKSARMRGATDRAPGQTDEAHVARVGVEHGSLERRRRRFARVEERPSEGRGEAEREDEPPAHGSKGFVTQAHMSAGKSSFEAFEKPSRTFSLKRRKFSEGFLQGVGETLDSHL
jgi:hypothetical protein